MEHSNPILMGNDSPQKFITIGEVMLRLTPPNYEKIRMASSFEASYGGSGGHITPGLGPSSAARPTLRWRWRTSAWIPPSSASCPTTLWAKALCAGCAATTYTARR